MAALTDDRAIHDFGDYLRHCTRNLRASAKIFKGALVAPDVDGRVVQAGHANALDAFGWATHKADNTGGANDAKELLIQAGVMRLGNSTSTEEIKDEDVGNVCYVVDDQTVSKTSNNGARRRAGRVVDVDSKGVHVLVGPKALPAVNFAEKKVLEADLTAAATTQTLDLGLLLPPNAQVLGAMTSIRLVTPFTGGALTAFTVSIGDANDDDCIIAAANIFAAAVDGQSSTRPMGIAPGKLYTAAAGTQLKAKFDSTGANVTAATAGEVILRVPYIVLP